MAVEEIDYNNMSDDDIDAILADINNGSYNGDTQSEENDFEDTEDSNTETEETETNQQDDGQANDTGSEDEDENPGHSQNESENTEEDENKNTETTTTEDAKSTETVIPEEFKSEFERYKQFYDQITNAEFTANGKKIKGFSDPEKIIRSQQMAHGFSEKMRGFNEYKPYLTALKEKGILDNAEKFNLAMSIIDGDKVAIKKHLGALKIDAVDLELDESSDENYTPKNYVASKDKMIVDDALEFARENGFEDKFREALGKQWDSESFSEFVKNPDIRSDLLEHMQDGSFDIIQGKISELEMFDRTGAYRGMTMIDKYRTAVNTINAENAKKVPAQQSAQSQHNNRIDEILNRANQQQSNVQNKNNNITPEQYRARVEEQKKTDEARKAAASVSKKKTVVTRTEKFDPLKLDGSDLDDFVNGLISGQIK